MIVNRSVPRATVIPVLGYPDVREAADWLCAAFGFTERLSIGNHRIQLVYGDGAVILTNRRDGSGPCPDVHIHVRVDDARAHHDRAARHGAKIAGPPADHPYGERQYGAEDPGGHRWVFSESIADVAPEDWGGTAVNLD